MASKKAQTTQAQTEPSFSNHPKLVKIRLKPQEKEGLGKLKMKIIDFQSNFCQIKNQEKEWQNLLRHKKIQH